MVHDQHGDKDAAVSRRTMRSDSEHQARGQQQSQYADWGYRYDHGELEGTTSIQVCPGLNAATRPRAS